MTGTLPDWHETGNLDDWRTGWWFSSHEERAADVALDDVPAFVACFAFVAGGSLDSEQEQLVMEPDFPGRFLRFLTATRARQLVTSLGEMLRRERRNLEQILRIREQAAACDRAAESTLRTLEALVHARAE